MSRENRDWEITYRSYCQIENGVFFGERNDGKCRISRALRRFFSAFQYKGLVESLKLDSYKINLIFHSMGILNPKKFKTNEGIEINFATSYLSRIYLTKLLFENQVFGGDSVLINIAASAEKLPNYRKFNFSN